MTERHNIEPVFDADSKILILGSFPSVKSREAQFFYAHPQNRFWRVISSICGCTLPVTVEEKKAMLLQSRIALWDVIQSCDITGSSDSSIKNVTVNDFNKIFSAADIRAVFANGATAFRLYKKYAAGDIIKLPSTSPANAAKNLDSLIFEWSVIKEYL